MNLSYFFQKRGLLVILSIFFILGSIGIFYDYSLNTNGDESVLMAAALKMLSDRTLRLDYPTFYHAPLAAYFYLPPFVVLLALLLLLGVFPDAGALKEFGVLNFYNFLPFARFLTVLMGLATIYFLYKAAQKLFNSTWIALSASFFLSSSIVFVSFSHLARVWIPQVMAVMLAFYLIVILYQRQEDNIKDYLFAGLGIGLAFGVHIIGIIVYAPFCVAHYLKKQPMKIKKIFLTNRYFWLVNLILAIFYFIIFYLSPHGFGNYINREGKIWPNFSFLFEYGATANVSADNSLAMNFIGSFKNFYYYPQVLFERETILLLFFTIGAVVLFFKQRRNFYFVFSFILAYYIGVTFSGLTWYYILPIIPFLAIMAGYGLVYLYEQMSGRINKPAALSLAILILILNFIPSLLWVYLAIQPSARLMARDWIYKNVPAESSLINFDQLMDFNENFDTLADTEKFSSGYLTKKRACLLSLPAEKYPKPNYYVFNRYQYLDPPKELLGKNYDYLIVSWSDREDLKNKLEQSKFTKNAPVLIKRFPEKADENFRYEDLWDMKRPLRAVINGGVRSPVLDIYKLE